MCKKGKAIPLQAWTGPKEVQAPTISRQSAHEYGTGRVYPPRNIPGTHLC
jgi:hypothetical protein